MPEIIIREKSFICIFRQNMHASIGQTNIIDTHPCGQVGWITICKICLRKGIISVRQWEVTSHFCITIGSGFVSIVSLLSTFCFAVRESAQPYMELSNTQSFPKIGVTNSNIRSIRSQGSSNKNTNTGGQPEDLRDSIVASTRRSISVYFLPQ